MIRAVLFGLLALGSAPVTEAQPVLPFATGIKAEGFFSGDAVRARSTPGSGLIALPGSSHLPPSVRAASARSGASEGFDAGYYGLDLRLSFDPDYLEGSTRIRGQAKRPLERLDLDFSSSMTVDSVTSPAGRLAFVHENDVLGVTLGTSIPSGGPVEVTIFYAGLPTPSDLGGFVFGTLSEAYGPSTGNRFAWSLSEPYGARTWWPSKDHPSDKADSVDVSVSVPATMRVGSNGLLVSQSSESGGRMRYTWKHRYPIASYLVSIAAGVYDVHEQWYDRPAELVDEFGPLRLPLLHYAYAGTGSFEGSHPQYGFRHVLEVFPTLESWFGPYPFDQEKYGHAQFTFGGAMEHQTMSSMTSSYVGTIAHELAHQWYGDAVSPERWSELWLNEGFATFGEMTFWEESDFEGVYDAIFDIYYRRALGARGTLVLQDTTDVFDMFDHGRVYSKGWMVLRMLRGVVGDQAFRRILRAYAVDPQVRFAGATTADFKRVAEAESGLDLSAFFSQWVTDGTGQPRYAVSWGKRAEGPVWYVEVTLEQTQVSPESNRPVFEMPVVVEVQTRLGPKRFRLENRSRRESFQITLGSEPMALRLDPDRWILRNPEVTVTGVDAALTAGRQGVDVFPNPARDMLEVRWPTGKAAEVQVLDLLGRVVARLSAGPEGSATIEVSAWPPGLYAIRSVDGADSWTQTFIRAR